MDFETFAAGFKKAGGCRVFGIPGGGPSLQLMDALERQGCRLVATGHESTAVLMAGAVGRFSGKPSLSISIKGPGFINMVPGLLCNSYENYPMISVSEAYASGDSSGRRHKWLDHEKVMGSCLRGMSGFQDGTDFFESCWNIARGEMPGPFHIDLAEIGKTVASVPAKKPSASALELLKKSHRPVLIAGSAVLHQPEWRKTIALLKIPVFTTVSAKGLVDENKAWSAGIYTGDGTALSPEKKILPEADLVLCLGVNAGEILSPKAPHPNSLFLNVEARVFPANPVREGSGSAGDEVPSFLEELSSYEWGAAFISEAFSQMTRSLSFNEFNPAVSMQAAMDILPDAVHVTDTGNFTVVAEHVLKSRSELDFLGTPNSRFMGAGLGYALGVALLQQERPVLLWIGDGGLRSYFSELALAAEHPSKLCVLVMEDGYYGSIMGRARQLGLTETPLALKPRDYLCAAEALGFASARVDTVQALRGVLEEWKRGAGKPLIVGCRFNAELYRTQAQLLR